MLSFKPRTYLGYLLPILDFSYTRRLYFINRLAMLGIVWSLISTIYVNKSLTHCENSVAGSCDTECMCLMSLAFVSINLKVSAWSFLCLKNLPVCQVLEDIKGLKCFLKIEARVCACVCVYVCVCVFPIRVKKSKKAAQWKYPGITSKMSPYSSEWELFV